MPILSTFGAASARGFKSSKKSLPYVVATQTGTGNMSLGSGANKAWYYLSSGYFNVTNAGTVNLALVGGGYGGGDFWSDGKGGNGGGYKYQTNVNLTVGNYYITIGSINGGTTSALGYTNNANTNSKGNNGGYQNVASGGGAGAAGNGNHAFEMSSSQLYGGNCYDPYNYFEPCPDVWDFPQGGNGGPPFNMQFTTGGKTTEIIFGGGGGGGSQNNGGGGNNAGNGASIDRVDYDYNTIFTCPCNGLELYPTAVFNSNTNTNATDAYTNLQQDVQNYFTAGGGGGGATWYTVSAGSGSTGAVVIWQGV